MRSPKRLRLISMNLQVGIANKSMTHYLGNLWQHILPSVRRHDTLYQAGQLMREYDLIALQEVDGGSFRTNFHDQVRTLCHHAELKYWHTQTNRDMGFWAQHSNAVISRVPVQQVTEHKLPGLLPGRGAIELDISWQGQTISIFIAHLSLGRRSQIRQLEYLADKIAQQQHSIVMGDLNVGMDWLQKHSPLAKAGMSSQKSLHTYPSWKPKKDLDHILVSEGLNIHNYQVLNHQLSDHLPISLEVSLKP